MRASVVIASLNEGDNLRKTVESCLNTTAGLDLEIVVADDGSTDGSLDRLGELRSSIRLVETKERGGASPTKDFGARNASGEVLVFLDGHCKPEEGALRRLVENVEEADGRAVFLPAIPRLDTDSWTNDSGHVGYGYYIDLWEFHCGWKAREELESSGRFYINSGLIGCCVAMSRQLYEELHGWDPEMRIWGVEDIDFGLRAWLADVPTLTDPDVLIGHRFRSEFDNFDVSREQLVVNQLRMARKSFSEPVWHEWVGGCRQRNAEWPGFFDRAYASFERGWESVEAERLHEERTRKHDEFWFAERFGLDWPKRRKGPG